jgi:single-stranded DNA-binding protein
MDQIIGTLIADAATNTTRDGKKVVTFTLKKVTRRYIHGEWQRIAKFFECAYWRAVGIAPYLTKDTPVVLYGEQTEEAYLSAAKEPKMRRKFHVDTLELFEGVGTRDGAQPPAAAQQSVMEGETAANDDDLPF